jgi:secondary thiamine-phosphate synthase enzyme
MSWKQKEITLQSNGKGFFLVTDQVLNQLPEISSFNVGLLHLFIKHTSASLAINENADSTVREDLESHFDIMVPENASYYKHVLEGPDDMPAHIKSVMIGSTILIPISEGTLNLGIWQGIYLCEHRDNLLSRIVVATINGQNI